MASRFSPRVVNGGFVVALVLASLSLVAGAFFVGYFLVISKSSVEHLLALGQTTGVQAEHIDVALQAGAVSSRQALLACGIFAGFSFGFLGFGLFLLGVEGTTDAEGQYGDAKVKWTGFAPGLVFGVFATVIIVACALHTASFDYSIESPSSSDTQAAASDDAQRQKDLDQLHVESKPPPP